MWRLTTSLLLGTCFSPCPLWAANFFVNNTNDAGAGSFRQAIINANATAETNTIIANGLGTITLTSGDLPAVQNNVTILGNEHALWQQPVSRIVHWRVAGTARKRRSPSRSRTSPSRTPRRRAAMAAPCGGGGGAGLGGALFVANRPM